MSTLQGVLFGLGVLSFLLFFISDCNDTWWKKAFGKGLFPLSCALLVISLAGQLHFFETVVSFVPVRLACLVLAAGALWLELDALFFSLPRQASYGQPGEQRAVCAKGVYALCRHPGVLFFCFFMLFLWLGAGLNPIAGAVYALLDILLAAFEDQVVFIQRIEGYAEYQSEVPFLIPNRRSAVNCLNRRK